MLFLALLGCGKGKIEEKSEKIAFSEQGEGREQVSHEGEKGNLPEEKSEDKRKETEEKTEKQTEEKSEEKSLEIRGTDERTSEEKSGEIEEKTEEKREEKKKEQEETGEEMGQEKVTESSEEESRESREASKETETEEASQESKEERGNNEESEENRWILDMTFVSSEENVTDSSENTELSDNRETKQTQEESQEEHKTETSNTKETDTSTTQTKEHDFYEYWWSYPDCVSAGYYVICCRHCDYSQEGTDQSRMAPLGHRLDGGTVTRQATCISTGERQYECTVCKMVVETEVLPIDSDAHLWVEDDAGWYCAACGREKE